MMRTNPAFSTLAVIAAALGAGLPAPALADDSPALEEVLVTATKRVADIQAFQGQGDHFRNVFRGTAYFDFVTHDVENTAALEATGLLEGEADHRDMIFSDEEHETTITVCCSRAKSARLKLDL